MNGNSQKMPDQASTEQQEAAVCEQASELAVHLYHERQRGVSRSEVMRYAETAVSSSIVDAVYEAPETGADIRTIGHNKCTKMLALTKEMSK